MKVDARGGLWLDDPLLFLGLLSLVWVLVACLHTEPWLRPHGYIRRLADGLRSRLGRAGRAQQRTRDTPIVLLVLVHTELPRSRVVEPVRMPAHASQRLWLGGHAAHRPPLVQLLAEDCECPVHRGLSSFRRRAEPAG